MTTVSGTSTMRLVRAAILARLEAGTTVQVLGWDAPDDLPSVTLGLPVVSRVGPDDPEPEHGSDQWTSAWPVTIYADASDRETGTLQALDTLSDVIAAFDQVETATLTAGYVMYRAILAEPVDVPSGTAITAYSVTIEARHIT